MARASVLPIDPTALDMADRRPALRDDTEGLTTRVAAGDPAALERFYRAWFDWMLAETRRATRRDEAFCLDVVQDAMMRVIRSIRPMRGQDDLRRWLRVVTWSCACDRLRAEARRARHERFRPDASRGPSSGAHATDPAELEEQRRWLAAQLARLDEPSAQLLLMRHRFGWTLERIGRVVGMKPGAVHGRLRRLLERLRSGAGGHDDA